MRPGSMAMKRVSLLYLVCVTVTAVLGLLNMNIKSGPYDMEVHKLDECPKSGTGKTKFSTRITKLDRNKYVYTGPIWIHPEVDEKSKLHVEVQQWGNGGYSRYMQYTVKNCEEMFTLAGEHMKDMFKASGVTVKGCPIPEGNWTVVNFELNFKMGAVPMMEYNLYRVLLSLYHENVLVGCLMGYGEAVPKPLA